MPINMFVSGGVGIVEAVKHVSAGYGDFWNSSPDGRNSGKFVCGVLFTTKHRQVESFDVGVAHFVCRDEHHRRHLL